MKMDKLRKSAGIYQDGNVIKLATFSVEKDIITLLNLDKMEISKKEKENDNTFDNDFLAGLGFGDDIKEEKSSDDFSWDDSSKDDKNQDEDVQEIEQIDVTELENLKSFFEENEVHESKISLNLDISNVFYKTIPAPPKKNKKAVIKELYSVFNEENSKSAIYSYYPLNENEIVGIKHENKMILLENILSISQFHPKRKFNFGKIQTDEVALLNAVRWNYDIKEDEISAIFYVGIDYSRIIIMKGYNSLQILPIINETTKSPEIVNTLYSRLLLEKSHHEIPTLNRIFLCGEDIATERIEALRVVEPECKIERLLPLRILDNDIRYNPENYTAYIIPIMLAIADVYPNDPSLLPVDFLPKKLLEQQNIFSLNVPGLIILVIILLTGLYGINEYFKLSSINRHTKMNIIEIKREISHKQPIVDSIAVLENKISQIKTNMKQVSEIVTNQNQWHYILKKMAGTVGENSVSWVTNLHKLDSDNFVIQGQTTIRSNVIKFSRMFPDSKIEKLHESEIEGYTVWNFEIIFSMPNPIKTKRQDALFEKKFKKKNKRKSIVKKKLELQNNAVLNRKGQEKKNESNNKLKDIEYLYDKALKDYRSKKFDIALKEFSEYMNLSKTEKIINAKYFTGECLYQLKDYKNALKIFDNVIEINKRKIPDALLMAANCEIKLNNNNLAKEYLNRLIKQFPSSILSEIAAKKLKRMD
jgi:TolA-binding protein